MDEHWEDKHIRKRLKDEAASITFDESSRREVLRAIRQPVSFWKKEIVIPAPVIGVILLLLLVLPLAGWRQVISLKEESSFVFAETPLSNERLIATDAGVFYESQLRKEGRP
ncbi:hypothetical protein [Paenibacillus sp. PL2-23]|uniref:hypothetical protein n=1 Tax=Paenibacillus sp. PL2-23 TaxID=2100729 RepID=UPI0030FCE576